MTDKRADNPQTTAKIAAYSLYYREKFRQRVLELRRELAVAEDRLVIAESQFVNGEMVTGFPKGESPMERLLAGPK